MAKVTYSEVTGCGFRRRRFLVFWSLFICPGIVIQWDRNMQQARRPALVWAAGAADVFQKLFRFPPPLPSRQQEVELAHYPLSSFANYAENTQKPMSLVT
jgi:hypothetical protein